MYTQSFLEKVCFLSSMWNKSQKPFPNCSELKGLIYFLQNSEENIISLYYQRSSITLRLYGHDIFTELKVYIEF